MPSRPTLLVTLARLRGRFVRAAPSSPVAAPGIPEAGTSPVPVSEGSLGRDPLQSSGLGPHIPGRQGPGSPSRSPPPPRPTAYSPRPSRAPSALRPPGPARLTHRGAASLAVSPAPDRHRVRAHHLRRLRPPLAPANQKPAAGSPVPRAQLYVRGREGRGQAERGVDWLGRRGSSAGVIARSSCQT